MAVARPAGAAPSGGIKAALIVFIVLTVLSLGFAIYLYTQQEDLLQSTSAANASADQANRRAQQAEQALADFAKQVAGSLETDPATIAQKIKAATDPIRDELVLAGVDVKQSSVLDVMGAAWTRAVALDGQRRAAEEEAAAARQQIDANADAEAERDRLYQSKTEELTQRYEQLEQQSLSDRQAWEQQIARLEQEIEARTEAAGQELNRERQLRRAVEEKLAAEQKRTQELLGQLAGYRPSGDASEVLRVSDGTVVRALARQDLVYISLGTRDRVRRGMTFAVYSRIRGVGPDGKGKATLEVITPFETTSECRVTSTTPGDPILEGDLIANPVYDRSKRFKFAVLGGFDLDFDGKVEDPGGEKVAAIITGLGGEVVRTVSTSTDFVVAGEPPDMPPIPGDDADDARKERYNEAVQKRDRFDAAINEAKALSIPVLTRTQFLHYIGSGAASTTPPEGPAS